MQNIISFIGLCCGVLFAHLLYCQCRYWYGVVMTSRLLKIIVLSCKRALLQRRYSAKETYHFKEPTNRSHPIYTFSISQTVECNAAKSL